jgi:hypothetical protein
MRLLVLYLRSRQVPLAVATAVSSVAALWSMDHATGRRATEPVALLAVVAATLTAGPGLGSADVELDRTAAAAWPPRRAAHVLAVCAAVVAIVAATGLTGEQMAPAGRIVRDAAGMSGLIAGGAVVLGAAGAWIPPLAWTVVAWSLLAVPPGRIPAYGVFTWMLQPAASTTAAVTAVILGAAGTLGYAIFGPRR